MQRMPSGQTPPASHISSSITPSNLVRCGSFVDDQFHGKDGRFFHADGELMSRPPRKPTAYEYRGDVDGRGLPHGKGDVTYADGTSYSGHWRHGHKHGAGRLSWPEATGADDKGRYYDGQWAHDLRHGCGVYVGRDGTRFEGEWHEGNKCGTGVYTYPNGKRFEVECGPKRPHRA